MNSRSQNELLHPFNMLRLYASGAFPMADESENINWYMPEIRAIIPLNNFNIPKSLQKKIKDLDFTIKLDNDYLSVIKGCADRDETWISKDLIGAYKGLKKIGHLHTVEVYQNNILVGGLYGITYRGAFFGESMFSKVSEASKAALAYLLNHLKQNGFILLDVQYLTPHLEMFGAVEISFNEFQSLLFQSYERNCQY